MQIRINSCWTLKIRATHYFQWITGRLLVLLLFSSNLYLRSSIQECVRCTQLTQSTTQLFGRFDRTHAWITSPTSYVHTVIKPNRAPMQFIWEFFNANINLKYINFEQTQCPIVSCFNCACSRACDRRRRWPPCTPWTSASGPRTWVRRWSPGRRSPDTPACCPASRSSCRSCPWGARCGGSHLRSRARRFWPEARQLERDTRALIRQLITLYAYT